MLKIDLLPALTDNYIYLLHDSVTGETAVVDPTEADPVLKALKQNGWRLDYIFNTHHHGDHVGANLQLKQRTGCKIVGATADKARIPGIDIAVSDGDDVRLGSQVLHVIDTPGHTLGHIVYYCAESQALFCGDTLFSLGCGRLFEGTAAQLYLSLQKLTSLPPETRVYCAHEYTEANDRFALTVDPDNLALHQRISQVAELRHNNQPTLPSSIGLELATNPFLRTDRLDIRVAIGAASSAGNAEVFATIRALKDAFH